jgi:hypothetical protein
MGRLTGREPVVTEVGSVRSEWLGQVQLDGEKDWRTAGGRRSGQGVLKAGVESQFDKFVRNDL